MRGVTLVLLLALAAPVAAHHTKEHVLGAPYAPDSVAPAAPDETGGHGFWWALGPFFVLAAVGVLRWGYRRHRDGKNRNARG